MLAAMTQMSQALTPSPVEPAMLAPPRLGGWRAWADEGGAGRVASLSRWAGDHLGELIALEEASASSLAGGTLLHGDLYPFNIMLTPDRVLVIDWPHAWVGAPHGDLLTLLSSASLSGLDPQAWTERHPLTRDLGPEAINVFLAVHAGFLLRLAANAGPGADRHLLAMATALGTASLRWLRRRLEGRVA